MRIDTKDALMIGWPFLKKLVSILWQAYKRHKLNEEAEEAHQRQIEQDIQTVYQSCRQIAHDVAGLFLSWKAARFDLIADTPPTAPGCDNADGERTFDEVRAPIDAGIKIIIEHTEGLNLREHGDREIIAAGVLALAIHELTGEDDVAWLPGDDEKCLYWMIVGGVASWRAKRAAVTVAKR